jgi:hypothetical protein
LRDRQNLQQVVGLTASLPSTLTLVRVTPSNPLVYPSVEAANPRTKKGVAKIVNALAIDRVFMTIPDLCCPLTYRPMLRTEASVTEQKPC